MKYIKKIILTISAFLLSLTTYSQSIAPTVSNVSIQKGETKYVYVSIISNDINESWSITNTYSNISLNTYGTVSTSLAIAIRNDYNTDIQVSHSFGVSFYNSKTYITSYRTFYIDVDYYVGCQENIVVSNTVLPGFTDTKSAEENITASSTINNKGKAFYDAGTTVYLKPDFHAKSGATFRAFIEGCSSTSSKIDTALEKEIALDEEVLADTITTTIYPNPTTGNFTITSNEVIKSYSVLNTLNNNLINKNVNDSKTIVDTYNLPAGIYIVRVELLSSKVITKKLIKK